MDAGMNCRGLRPTASPMCRGAWKLRRSCVVAWNHFPRELRRRDRFFVVNAEKNDNDAFVKGDYVEAVIDHVSVKKEEQCGVVDFRLKDGRDSILPMYVGSFEASALLTSITNKETVRPMTHDLMRNSLRLLGYQVTQVHVTALVGYTYHARVFYRSGSGEEVSCDARPSDAVNLAVRFKAPIYIHRDVASRMATSRETAKQRSEVDVVKACREELKLHNDPTVVLKLQMQMAIAEEKYTAAAKLRDEIDKLLSSNRVLGLVVALESALSGSRYEEALQIRDALRELRTKQEGSEKQESH